MVTYTMTQYLKADILNKQFYSVYTKEDYTNMPDKGPSPYPSMMKIQVNNQGVIKLLRGLRPYEYSKLPVLMKSQHTYLRTWLTIWHLI